ncbi:TIR domain-containing protein [Tenacibaculum amylolyticum]|uniref:TIR domain-containing protein n=1 Tax=Tenacibaculum amylolyticum TaxID=104269 RepID=UPI00389578FC
MKSIFVSHVYEDQSYVSKMQKWEKKGLLEGYTFTFETEDKRHEGKQAIRNYLKKIIEGCAVIVVLIGNDTHNHDWIRAEVELANSFHKRILCMRIPETTGGKPVILKNYKEIIFHPNQIIKELST